MDKIKILVADDHEIVRYGICSVLATADDIEVVGESSTGAQTVEMFKKLKPDVSIIDITMPDMNGIETTREIHKLDPNAKILILTMHLNEEYLSQTLKSGAMGYMLKNSDKKELLEAIRKVYRGRQVFSEPISKLMAEKYVRITREQEKQEDKVHITNREKEILRLIVDGYTSHEIAQLLFISPRTVDTHRANLMQKLDIKNTAGLVRYAMENHLVD